MSPLLTAAYLHEKGAANYHVHLDSWAEWVMNDMPRTEEGGLQHITYLTENYQQLWDDTLMMSVLPLAKIGLVLDRPHYVEEAKRQFILQWVFRQIIHPDPAHDAQCEIPAGPPNRALVPRCVADRCLDPRGSSRS